MASNAADLNLINGLSEEWSDDVIEYELTNDHTTQPVRLQTSVKYCLPLTAIVVDLM